jgi:hypothetical protein
MLNKTELGKENNYASNIINYLIRGRSLSKDMFSTSWKQRGRGIKCG